MVEIVPMITRRGATIDFAVLGLLILLQFNAHYNDIEYASTHTDKQTNKQTGRQIDEYSVAMFKYEVIKKTLSAEDFRLHVTVGELGS